MNKDTTEIKSICQEIADYYKNLMKEADYNPADPLMNFTWTTEYNGSLFQIYFNLPEYWYYAENGRKPGKFPPPDKILHWVQFKKLVPRPGRDGKIPTTNQLVYLISRKIALKGTEGKHLLQQTIDETYDTLVDNLVDAITNQLEKEITQDIDYEYTFK